MSGSLSSNSLHDHNEQAKEHGVARSSLVRRLVVAKDDPAKQRIRAWLGDIDDGGLHRLGLTSEDIAALRGTAGLPVEATIAPSLDAPSDDTAASPSSPVVSPEIV